MSQLTNGQAEMFKSKPNVGRELLDVPMGDMIRDMAFAIADAQIKLDANSIKVAQMLGGIKEVTKSMWTYDRTTRRITRTSQVSFEDSRVFFGKERLKLLDSIDIYNTSSDTEYKIRILQNLGTMNYEYDCISTTNKDLTALKSDTKCNTVGAIYSTEGDQKKFYRYEGTTGSGTSIVKNFTEIQYYNVKIKRTNNASSETYIYMPTKVSMLELGFSPTFYQFVDTIIEVKMSITYTCEGTEGTDRTDTNGFSAKGGFFGASMGVARSSSVNATFSQKYSYSVEGASLLRTKLVPIPPPAILEERIRALMEVAKEEQASNTPIPDEKEPINSDSDE